MLVMMISEKPASENALEVLYEDEGLIAVNKPPGVVVHPTYKNVAGTLLDALRARHDGGRLFLLGRLDKLTSGLVIAAKRREIYAEMQRSWHEAEKDYLAVVVGPVGSVSGDIDFPLGPDPGDRRRRVVRPDGAPSLTRFERLSYSDAAGGLSLLRCRLVTGRRHQIRVHLAACGWPIVGDPVYGGRETPLFPRQALHAWRVTLPHAASEAPLRLQAPLPADLRDLMTGTGLLTSHLHL
jgi:23S rRNA pseudouridine1911/1915/1917 synthase